MALFKVSKGTSQNLPSTLTEGYCWYTYDDSKFYIDFKDEKGVLTRKALNATEAEKLTGYTISTVINSSNIEIPTSKAVLDKIATATANLASTKYVNDAISNIDIPSINGLASEDYVDGKLDAHTDNKSNPHNVTAEQIGIYIGPDEPTDPNIKIWINTAEDGTCVTPILPRIATITLPASGWTGSSNPYSQVLTVNGVTVNSKVDLQPTAQQILSLQNEDIALMAENNAGVVTIYALGGKPSTDYTMQVLLTEVAYV